MSYYYERQGLRVPHFDSCRVKVPKGVPKVWEPHDYAELVRAAGEFGAREQSIVLLTGDCGLRTGEAIGLEWSHVRWEPTPQLTIQRAFWRGHWGPPKGGRSRTVPMTSRVVAALRAMPRSISEPWVCTREKGGALTHETHSSMSWALGNVERAIGEGKRGSRGKLHKLRHTYVTRLAAANVPAREIMELAGHTRMETTMRYMHALPGARAVAALERFDQATSEEHHEANEGGPDRKSGS